MVAKAKKENGSKSLWIADFPWNKKSGEIGAFPRGAGHVGRKFLIIAITCTWGALTGKRAPHVQYVLVKKRGGAVGSNGLADHS